MHDYIQPTLKVMCYIKLIYDEHILYNIIILKSSFFYVLYNYMTDM